MPGLNEIRKSRERTATVELVPGLTASLTYEPDAFTAAVSAAFRDGIQSAPALANTTILRRSWSAGTGRRTGSRSPARPKASTG